MTKVHYLASDTRQFQKTPCGIDAYPTKIGGEADTSVDNRIDYSTDMDKVTCKRCVRCWNAFVKAGL